MNFILKIAQNSPHREQLEKAITDLLHFIEAGAVYVSCNDNINKVVITFVLDKKSSQDGEVLSKTSHKWINLYRDFIFKFINSNEIAYGFKKGKPYFIQHCTVKELVYFEPKTKLFYPHKNTSKILVKKAKKRFNLDIEAAVVSFRNVSIYTRNNKSIEAAFALHQTLRYIYICASEFLTPEFISPTCLLAHYDYIIDFAPTLKKILNKDIQEDKEIFVVLNTAYSCVIHNNSMIVIDDALTAIAKTKIELMQREMKNLFTEYMALCKEKVRELNHQNFLGKSIFNHKIRTICVIYIALVNINAVLIESFKIRSIYCFGFATIHDQKDTIQKGSYSKRLPKYHFYLLVVNLEFIENAIPLMQNLIREKFEGRYKATVLNHSSGYVRKKNQNQKCFFDNIITNGLLVYNNPLYLPYPKTTIVERDMGFSKRYAEDRILIAQQLLSLAQNCFNDDSVTIKKVLFRKVMEQIAIGLIYLYLGYYSGKFSINYLFSLLKYIQEVDLPFDFNDAKDIALYQYLSETIELSKLKEMHYSNIEDNKIIENKCIAFLEYAKELRENAFEKLEDEWK